MSLCVLERIGRMARSGGPTIPASEHTMNESGFIRCIFKCAGKEYFWDTELPYISVFATSTPSVPTRKKPAANPGVIKNN